MALEKLALAHLDELYAFALRLTGIPERAEDLVQDTFLRLMTYKGKPPNALRPFLFKVLRNLHIDAWRRLNRIDENQPLPPEPEDDTEPPDALALKNVLSEWVEAALAELEIRLRETVWLREVEGFSYEEIGEITEVPLGTVRSRLARGRRQLQARLAEQARTMGLLNRQRVVI